jgi:mRNA-degrading endonuclease RelE of RelBE toxin-antitoxin system
MPAFSLTCQSGRSDGNLRSLTSCESIKRYRVIYIIEEEEKIVTVYLNIAQEDV